MHITAGLRISRAFILGAGLGTRLRPLTGILPKPLIPFFHEPLILHSMRRCYDCGIREFIINTHHLAAAWDKVFPEHSWNGCPVHFSHEPVLLDSGGGVKKIEPLASAEEPLLVVNGDMAATFDLGRLLEEHLSRRPPVTLALRTSGDKKNVGFDFSSGLVTDMRHALGRDPGSCQFTGAYCMEPEIFGRIPSGEAVSIIPLFLDYIREGRLRGILADDG
ncbi:MAG: nucleotidyltransferase family protein, partial [Akkermansia sp.]|nr:nucleotidyltransferase family protein [Akkermansia sp.]